MITAIIVDDEPDCSEILATLLERYCPQVKVLEICYNGEKGLKAIRDEKPQLVFLDIEMPQMNGFELLEKLQPINFKLIFTTSYDQYAIKAIKFSALDYLLKPIDREELQQAVKKAIEALQVPIPQQFEVLLQKIKSSASPNQKIALPTLEGLQLVSVDEIISCESDRNYTYIYMKSKVKLTISRSLKEIEEMLEDYSFLRVHHSYIVNLNEISKYIRGEGGYLIMSDGSNVDVSRSRKETLIQRLQKPY